MTPIPAHCYVSFDISQIFLMLCETHDRRDLRFLRTRRVGGITFQRSIAGHRRYSGGTALYRLFRPTNHNFTKYGVMRFHLAHSCATSCYLGSRTRHLSIPLSFRRGQRTILGDQPYSLRAACMDVLDGYIACTGTFTSRETDATLDERCDGGAPLSAQPASIVLTRPTNGAAPQ